MDNQISISDLFGQEDYSFRCPGQIVQHEMSVIVDSLDPVINKQERSSPSFLKSGVDELQIASPGIQQFDDIIEADFNSDEFRFDSTKAPLDFQKNISQELEYFSDHSQEFDKAYTGKI